MDTIKSTSFIKEYQKNKKRRPFNKHYFEMLCDNICEVLLEWCGKTWVGQEKSDETKNAYQNFFEAFNNLIYYFEENIDKLNYLEKDFLEKVAFRGNVYRLLGSNNHLNNSKIRPLFNTIFVSWSKNKENFYLESKLYGPITRLYCQIEKPNFGIDIEGFTDFYHHHISDDVMIARGNEREVVFPTIRKTIIYIEYLRENKYDNT